MPVIPKTNRDLTRQNAFMPNSYHQLWSCGWSELSSNAVAGSKETPKLSFAPRALLHLKTQTKIIMGDDRFVRINHSARDVLFKEKAQVS